MREEVIAGGELRSRGKTHTQVEFFQATSAGLAQSVGITNHRHQVEPGIPLLGASL